MTKLEFWKTFFSPYAEDLELAEGDEELNFPYFANVIDWMLEDWGEEDEVLNAYREENMGRIMKGIYDILMETGEMISPVEFLKKDKDYQDFLKEQEKLKKDYELFKKVEGNKRYFA